MTAIHFEMSSYREKLLEHLFIGELLKGLWRRNQMGVEILRPEVDCGGYDLVVDLNGITRHIQLKASFSGGKASKVNVNANLQEKPNWCIIWLRFDPASLDLGPFFWFGKDPGCKLPNLKDFPRAKHTKADAKGTKAFRKNTYSIRKSDFKKLITIDEVIQHLFGLCE